MVCMQPQQVILLDGDLVLRNGKGVLSAFFKCVSQKDSRFSHAGLVRIIDGRVYVCHYIDEGYRMEPFGVFTGRSGCTSFSVLRYNLTACQRTNLLSMIDSEEAAGRLFDSSFDLSTDDDLYCTEWIYKCLGKIGFPLSVSKAGTSPYIATDDLYVKADVKQVTAFEYEN